MQVIFKKASLLSLILASAFAATKLKARAQNATLPANLPNAQGNSKFAWVLLGNIFGDVPGTLIFADTRGDQSAPKLHVRRADTVWGYIPCDEPSPTLFSLCPRPVQTLWPKLSK
jgi:hypothetical protein